MKIIIKPFFSNDFVLIALILGFSANVILLIKVRNRLIKLLFLKTLQQIFVLIFSEI